MDAKFERLDDGSAPAVDGRPAVALLPAGGALWEDFLDTLGVPLERFCAEGPGGWMLGYMDALGRAGLRTVLVFFSARVDRPARWRHGASGDLIVVFPAPAAYRTLRRRFPAAGEGVAGAAEGVRGRAARLLAGVGPYLSTPLAAVARELRRERCRAIICQEYEYFRFESCLVLGRLLGVPVFATFQGADAEHNPVARAMRPHTIGGAAGLLIAAGREIERVRRAYGPGVRAVQVFNPVDVDEWSGAERDAARADLGLGPATRVAVWHGRIVINSKGLDVLLAAWARVRRERPGRDLRLLLMGTGPDAAEFARQLAALDAPEVTWRNEYVTDRAIIRRFLAAGDVYAFPSRYEGFAVAPIEAMACGLPVVAADASGVPDIFQPGEGAGGIVVARDDVEGFAAALGRLLDDPALSAELGRRARRRVEEAFSLDAVGRQLRAALLDAGVALDAPERVALRAAGA